MQALDYAFIHPRAIEINLGTSHEYFVLELVKEFEKASRVKIPYVIDPRRLGDEDRYLSMRRRAENLLAWKARHNLAQMCRDSWSWQQKSQWLRPVIAGISNS